MKIQYSFNVPYISEKDLHSCMDVRTFVFERQDTHQSVIIDHRVNTSQEGIDLSPLFDQYCPLKQHKISIYDPQLNRFVMLSKMGAQIHGIVPKKMLEARVVMIRFKKSEEDGELVETDSGIESGLESGRQKKDRSKERTIGESIQVVKRWRMVHLDSNRLGRKKLSLGEAARAIGVSKKTLDDYYYQLRLGQFYNFDFANNLNQKVGILRAYVKEFKPERQEKNKNLRHPKNLKIIEMFQLDVPAVIEEAPPSPVLSELKSPESFKSLSLEQDSEQNFNGSVGNPFIKDVMTSYEDKFFKNFEFLLDDPNDPFIQIDRNFKKKEFQQSSNDFFFF